MEKIHCPLPFPRPRKEEGGVFKMLSEGSGLEVSATYPQNPNTRQAFPRVLVLIPSLHTLRLWSALAT
jgi:hypothetical protein